MLIKYKTWRLNNLKTGKWASQQKLLIVREGFKEKIVAQICSDYAIHQYMYYKWSDAFLSNAHKSFEKIKTYNKISKLEHKNIKLKQLVGTFTFELKKTKEY